MFSLESSVVKLGLIDFTYLPKVETVMRMAGHPNGPKIAVHMPYRSESQHTRYTSELTIVVALDEESFLVAELHAGGCNLTNASLSLHPQQDDIQLHLDGATCSDRGAPHDVLSDQSAD